jgi:hypothetical protein
MEPLMVEVWMYRKNKATMDHKSINFHIGWTTKLIKETAPVTTSIRIKKSQNCFWLWETAYLKYFNNSKFFVRACAGSKYFIM